MHRGGCPSLGDENSPYSFESILDKIIARRPRLKREEILEIVEKKRDEAGSLLNREGAAFLVAAELGVPLADSSLSTKLEIKDLMSSLNNVTVIGRVLAVSPQQKFSRKDGSQGRLRRLLIGDRSGMLEVYLWDNKVEELDQLDIKKNTKLQVIHGYTRQSLSGSIELHLGDRGTLEVLPPTVAEVLPPLSYFLVKIGEVKVGSNVHLEGRITDIFPLRRFTRPDGEGKVLKLILEDETGRINIVAWNKKAEEIEAAKLGDRLELLGGTAKEDNVGKLEVHANWHTYLEVFQTTVTRGKQKSQDKG
jgi:replication factor A1